MNPERVFIFISYLDYPVVGANFSLFACFQVMSLYDAQQKQKNKNSTKKTNPDLKEKREQNLKLRGSEVRREETK